MLPALTAAQITELRRLYWEENCRPRTLARQFHISESTVYRHLSATRHGVMGPRGSARPLTCAICHTDSARSKIRRFSLARQQGDHGRNTSRGAGAIDLCQKCWEVACRPHMRAPRLPGHPLGRLVPAA